MPTEPFDQDQPARRPAPGDDRRGRRRGPAPTGRGQAGSGRPPGDGWDDGRSRDRTRRSGGSGGSGGSGRGGGSGGREGSSGKDNGGTLAGLPRWVVPAVGGVVVVLLLLVVVKSCSGGGGRTDAGPCLSDLLTHLPAEATTVYGTDLVQARHAGFREDGSLEQIGQSITDTGVIPDPVTTQFRIAPLATPEVFEARTGVTADDIECSLSDGRESVLTGSFDAAAVKGSDAGSGGQLAATDDLLASTTGSSEPAGFLKPAKDDGLAADDDVKAVLASLRDNEAYSVIVQRGDGTEKNGRPVAAGIGAGGTDKARTVVLAWSFPSDDAAKAGRPVVVDRVNAILRGTVSITNRQLTVDGHLVTAVIDAPTAPDLQGLLQVATRLLPPPPKGN